MSAAASPSLYDYCCVEWREPLATMDDIWHVIITRFSYRSLSTDVAARSRAASDWEPNFDPLDPQRLALRFAVFEFACAPSVLAQTNKDFDWVIVIDKNLPSSERDRLRRCVGSSEKVHVHEFSDTQDLTRCDWLTEYAPQSASHWIATVLDDDDALPTTFIDAIHSTIKIRFNGCLPPLMTFGTRSTFQWELIRSRRTAFGYRCDWHRGNFVRSVGFSLFCRYYRGCPTPLGVTHQIADVWFENHDESELSGILKSKWGADIPPGMVTWITKAIAEFRARTPLVNEAIEWRRSRGADLFFDVGSVAGPSIMTNHFFNVTSRLFEQKVDRRPVAGPESFPNTAVRMDIFRHHSNLFRKRWRMYGQLLRLAVGASPSSFGRSQSAYAALEQLWCLLRL